MTVMTTRSIRGAIIIDYQKWLGVKDVLDSRLRGNDMDGHCLSLGIITVLLLVTVLLLGTTFAADAEPIVLYDLQYADAIDAKDPRQLEMAWDHCHLVSALQGIVNRQSPRLYVLFVESNHRKINIDQYWLDYLRKPGNWLDRRPLRKVDGLVNLVQQFCRRDQRRCRL